MPQKRDTDTTYGQKLLKLFGILLFSQRKYSLTELSKQLNCSKQTVIRLVDDINSYQEVVVHNEMRGNRKYYHVKRPNWTKAPVPITPVELQILQLCRAFSEHLLGKEQIDQAALAIFKSGSLSPEDQPPSDKHFGVIRPGTVDYTPYQDSLRTLIEAMEQRKICKVRYQRIMGSQPKTFYIKPLKIFSHHDTVYVHTRKARYPGKKYKEPDYDPLLVVHRLKQVEMTDTLYEYPGDYDYEKVFNQHFGIIKGESFQVKIECTGWAANYISERIWSKDQEIEKVDDETIIVSFNTSSVSETVSNLLWFGSKVKVIEPEWLIEKFKNSIQDIYNIYHI